MSTLSCIGTWPAVVTPFTENGLELDLHSLGTLLESLLVARVSGFVIAGSTGEAAALSDEEYRTLLLEAKKIVGTRVPLIAGINSSNADKARRMMEWIKEAKYDGALMVPPPYSKPSQQGILEFFRAAVTGVGLPVIAYNIPHRTACQMSVETLTTLFEEGTISGVKECTGSLEVTMELYRFTDKRLNIVSGEDTLVYPLMMCGGRGTISASANVLPEHFVALVEASEHREVEKACSLQTALLPVVRALFSEPNPTLMKEALAWKKVIRTSRCRLPFVPASLASKEKLRAVLEKVEAVQL